MDGIQRMRSLGAIAVGPRHRLTLEEALFAHTIDAAYAIGAEHRLGSLEPTKDADLTIVAGDIPGVDPASLAKLPIRSTVVRGATQVHGRVATETKTRPRPT